MAWNMKFWGFYSATWNWRGQGAIQPQNVPVDDITAITSALNYIASIPPLARWRRTRTVKFFGAIFAATILAGCAPLSTDAREAALSVADEFEIVGWNVTCTTTPVNHEYRCAMWKSIETVGPFRFEYSADEVIQYTATCGGQVPWKTSSVARDETTAVIATEIFLTLRRTVDRCDPTALGEIDGAEALIALLLNATAN